MTPTTLPALPDRHWSPRPSHGRAESRAEAEAPTGASGQQAPGSFVGRQLGRYQLGDLIGTGGMGEVYRAVQDALARTVAVKVLHPWLCSDEQMIERFYQEARAASQLNHPNSVAVIDFGVDDGRPFLVMEYLSGKSLVEHVTVGSLLPVRRVCEVLLDVLSALSEAHAAGIVHRDLKPENVLLVPRRAGGEAVKVVDFGLAQLVGATDGSLRRTTEPGLCVGTPEYMAPEQFLGEEVDPRADLYAIGVVLYELLAGTVPFRAERFTELARKHVYSRPPDLLLAASDRATPLLARIVRRALSKHPDDRFASAAQMGAALRCALQEQRPSNAAALRDPRVGSVVVVPRLGPPVGDANVRSRRILQAAAVLGGRGSREVILAVAGETDDVLLAELVFRGALLPTARDAFTLDSETREEVERALPLEVRRGMHDRAYEHLLEKSATPEVLAHHAAGGSDPVLALVLLEQVGDEALARHAWTDAVTAYRRALETARCALLQTGDEQFGEGMATFSERLAQALCSDGHPAEAEGVLREALCSAPPHSMLRPRLLSALQPIAQLRALSS